MFFRWYGAEAEMPVVIRDVCERIKTEAASHAEQPGCDGYLRAHVMSVDEELSLPEGTPRYEPRNYAPVYALVPLVNPEPENWAPGTRVKSLGFSRGRLIGWREYKSIFPNVKY